MTSVRWKSFGVAVLVVLLPVLPAVPASAHATLVESTPADSSVVGQGPPEVTLRYDQPVSTAFGAVKVLAPDGSRVETGSVTTRDGGRTVVESLHSGLASGTYTILWRVLSADSHTVFGAATFSVGRPSATGVATAAAAEQASEGRAAEDLLDISRLVLYLGLLLLVGGLAFLFLLWPAGQRVRGVRRMLWVSWVLAILGSVGCLLMQGPYSQGLPLVYAFDPELIGKVLQTSFGLTTAVRLVLMIAAAVVLLRLGPVRSAILGTAAGIVSLSLLLSTSLIGHAGDGDLAVLGLPADVLHLAAASAWMGGLVLLAAVILRRRPPADLAVLMPRWSRYAEFVVVMLAVAAVARARVRRSCLRAVEQAAPAMVPTASLVSVGAGSSQDDCSGDDLSAGNDRRDGEAVIAGSLATTVSPGVARQLRRGVLLEAGIAVVVLAVTAVLVSTPPAKDNYFPTFDISSSVLPDLSVRVVVDPARVGLNTMHFTYTDSAGRATDVVAASARWTLQGGDEVVPVQLPHTGRGHYDLTRVELSTVGTWQLAITTQTDDINSSTTLFTVRIR